MGGEVLADGLRVQAMEAGEPCWHTTPGQIGKERVQEEGLAKATPSFSSPKHLLMFPWPSQMKPSAMDQVFKTVSLGGPFHIKSMAHKEISFKSQIIPIVVILEMQFAFISGVLELLRTVRWLKWTSKWGL